MYYIYKKQSYLPVLMRLYTRIAPNKTTIKPTKPTSPHTILKVLFSTAKKTMPTKKSVATSFQMRSR